MRVSWQISCVLVVTIFQVLHHSDSVTLIRERQLMSRRCRLLCLLEEDVLYVSFQSRGGRAQESPLKLKSSMSTRCTMCSASGVMFPIAPSVGWCGNYGDTTTDGNTIAGDEAACTPSTQSQEDGSSILYTGMRDVTSGGVNAVDLHHWSKDHCRLGRQPSCAAKWKRQVLLEPNLQPDRRRM